MNTFTYHKVADTTPKFPAYFWHSVAEEWQCISWGTWKTVLDDKERAKFTYWTQDNWPMRPTARPDEICGWCEKPVEPGTKHTPTEPNCDCVVTPIAEKGAPFDEAGTFNPDVKPRPTVTPEDEIVDAIRRVDREYGGDFSKFASEASTAAEQAVRTVNERHAKSPLWSAAAQPVAQLPDEVREAKADAVELAREILRLDKSCMGSDDRDDFMGIAIELFFEKRLKHITAPDVQKVAEELADELLFHKTAPARRNIAAHMQRLAAGLTAERDAEIAALRRDKEQLGEERRTEWIRAERAEAQLAEARAEVERLKGQLEHEFAFEAATDAFAKDQPAWEKLPDMDPEKAFSLLCKQALEPSDASIRLAKFIPLERQFASITNRQLWALHKWMTDLRAQLAAAQEGNELLDWLEKNSERQSRTRDFWIRGFAHQQVDTITRAAIRAARVKEPRG